MDNKDAKNRIIDPAINGTINVLNSVNKNETVKRVVLTISCYGIYGDNIDAPNIQFNESDWNISSSVKHQPYAYPKVAAETVAWKMQKGQERLDLVVINPSFIMVPATNPKANLH